MKREAQRRRRVEEKTIAVTEYVHRLTRKQQQANDLLAGAQTHSLLVGGSRSGKTFLLVRTIVYRALAKDNSRHAIFRYRFNALKASVMLDTLPKVIRLCFPQLVGSYEITHDGRCVFLNGSEIWFCGLDEAERVEKILGMEFATILFNECSQIPYSSVLTALTRLAQKIDGLRNKAYYDLNPTSTGHWTYLLFVQKKDPLTKQPLANADDYAYMFINPHDNAENISDQYMALLEAMPERTKKRFLEGKYTAEVEGQLWTVDLLAKQRMLEAEVPKDLARITVNIDPSGASGNEDKRSDEVGITVTARWDGHKDGKRRGILLADASGRYKPEQWGRIAASLYKQYNADAVVGEVNYGGDMVRATVHAHDPNIKFIKVTATRGKVVRAEPVSALYDQGYIMHAGVFADLEDQLCNFSTAGYMGERSPDRADSAIWGFTELLLGKSTTGLLEYYKQQYFEDKAKLEALGVHVDDRSLL